MKTVVVLSLDVGVHTGWAVIRKHDHEILGCGVLLIDDLGCYLDLTIRWLNTAGYTTEAVVEKMPSVGGIGELSTVLEYARKTTEYWLTEVYAITPVYILPGTWKTSRVAITTKLPTEWGGHILSQHEKDAVLMAMYYAGRGDK